MKAPLHVLHLEDDPRDTELIRDILEAEGIVSHVTRVETQTDFIASLERGGFDLILADYSLPSFDGLSALTIALERCPDLPFIFVSGALGEETAIEAVKGGATDYVLKERPSRIVPCVQRALLEVEERSKRKRAEAQLARVNRITTLGVVAASIAHEVNQPLGAIVTSAASCSRWLAAEPPDLEKARRALERIGKDGQRASEVIARIRALVQRETPRKDPVDINDTILEVVALTRDEIQRNDIVLCARLAEGLPLVPGDRVELRQVILNLIVNAIEAMSKIDDRCRELTIVSDVDGPKEVRVEVRDSGPGIAPEVADKLFEAFNTTKPGGIGLGLSISRSIIEAHRGRVWARGNVPEGTVFQFSLPVDEGELP